MYCVYVHKYASGKDKGRVFYVGKGKKRRPYATKNRSKHWERIVEKYGYTIEVLVTLSDEVCAFSIEMSLIEYFGVDNLCNITKGGEGLSGCTDDLRLKMSLKMMGNTLRRGVVLSEETKRRISKSKSGINSYTYDWGDRTFVRISDGLVFTGKTSDFIRNYNLTASSVSKLKSGSLLSHKGWKLESTT